MYGELASVQGIVDLSPQEALDRAEGFLAAQGYVIGQRTYTTVTAERRDEGGGRDLLTLMVAVAPQPEGGVRMTVRGNDQEGVQQRQAAWTEWSESLPKKPESETAEAAEQDSGGTADVPLSPPPQVGSAKLPPPPQSPPTRGNVPPVTSPAGEEHRPRNSLGKFVVGFWVFIVALWLLIPPGGGSGGGGNDDGGGKVAEKPKQQHKAARQGQPQKKEQPQKEARAQGGSRSRKNRSRNSLALA